MEKNIENLKDMKSELARETRRWTGKYEQAKASFQDYVDKTGYGNAIAWYGEAVIHTESVSEKLTEVQDVVIGMGEDFDLLLGLMEKNRDMYLYDVLRASFDSSSASHRLCNKQEFEALKTLHEIFAGLVKILMD